MRGNSPERSSRTGGSEATDATRYLTRRRVLALTTMGIIGGTTLARDSGGSSGGSKPSQPQSTAKASLDKDERATARSVVSTD
ncbi:hypothetical protein OFM04_33025, partial [Escherichia coli]|nr:hypothetical protein [Escherichia coli]